MTDILGSEGVVNIKGGPRKKLDVYANQILLHCLSLRQSIGILASEENDNPIMIPHDPSAASYAVIFDPLDGSSNIDVSVSVGTTFRSCRPEGVDDQDVTHWLLQPGSRQVAAGYVVYGSSTTLVYSVGNGVHGFTLDPAIGAYVLSHENIKIPRQGKYYSVNEGTARTFSSALRTLHRPPPPRHLGQRYGLRYIGSMVADFGRS